MVGHLCCLQFWFMITNIASWTPVYSVYVCECMLSHVLLFFNPMDGNPPGSSVHGILQARILEWVASPFSRGSSQPRGQIWVSCIAGRFFIIWAYVYVHTNHFVNIRPDFSGKCLLDMAGIYKIFLKNCHIFLDLLTFWGLSGISLKFLNLYIFYNWWCWAFSMCFFPCCYLYIFGEGNGTPLQYSCL